MYRLPAFPDCWSNQLDLSLVMPLLTEVGARLQAASFTETIVPNASDVFRALVETPPEQVRCVIVGQDPYHGEGQAMGLSFSVPVGCPKPPSLRNLLRERDADLGLVSGPNGDLTPWARSGVLLLNRVLTVQSGNAGSHRGLGWEPLTDAIIRAVSASQAHCVFVLWGRDAQSLAPCIDQRHTVLSGVHPSPLSAHRGFFGSRPFSRVNDALIARGQSPISWALPGDHRFDGEGDTAQLF